MNITLSQDQEAALESVHGWLKDGGAEPFRLFGAAGTGKSSIAHRIAEMINGRTIFATFTGKAAHVLCKKGADAVTVHSLIYLPKEKCAKRLERLEHDLLMLDPEEDREEYRKVQREVQLERKNVASPSWSLNRDSDLKAASLLVVDECSMISEQMGEDLISFGTPVLALGDPYQLPPVAGRGYFNPRDPDALLEEIHRQAALSPVLELATKARSGKAIAIGDYGDSRVVRKGTLSVEELAAHDQVLCGTNKTRRAINNTLRLHKGFTDPMPMVGDRLICLRNNSDRGLLNGQQFEVLTAQKIDADQIVLGLLGEDGERQELIAWAHYFQGRERELAHYEIRENEAFDFGYCVTVHKAQGSEWGSVALIDESRSFRQEAKKHLYTGITRASESITVIV